MAFTGLLYGDFDFYAPERQSSNSWNRQRLEVKERAMALGALVRESLEREGLPLSLEGSDPNPSVWNRRRVDAQWVFLWRSPEERESLQAVVDHEKKLADSILDPTPFQKHIFLCLRLFHGGLEVGLRLHRDAWVDNRNVRSRCASEEGLAAVVALVRALPERFYVAAPDVLEESAKTLDVEKLDAILGAFGETSEWLVIGERLDVDEVVNEAERLADRAAASLGALVPLYRYLAWSRENDWTRIDEALEAQAAARQAARLALEAERRTRDAERREQAREALERTRERERDAALSRAHAAFGGVTRKPQPVPSAGKPAAAASATRPATAPTKPSAPKRAARPRPEPVAVAAPPPEPIASGRIEKGVRVQITGGPFSGKVGTVAEIDTRGQAKVLLGLLMARVELSQLTPVGRG